MLTTTPGTSPSSVGATALFVAASRALEANKPDPLVVDPYAEIFCRAVGGEWADVLDGKAPENKLMSEFGEHFVNYQAARTKFFDDYFYAAADADVRQIVILAAGLDSRAYRLAWPEGTVVFELDQPQVLEFKQDVLTRTGEAPTAERREIGVDLRDDWPRALLHSGFDPSRPSAWLAEGLLVYLPAAAQGELFTGINDLAAPGSHVAVDEGKPIRRRAFRGGTRGRACVCRREPILLADLQRAARPRDRLVHRARVAGHRGRTARLLRAGRPTRAGARFRGGADVRQHLSGQRQKGCDFLAEHEVAHETRHPAQVVRLADMQDVVAGEPVERAAVPVLPQRLRLLRRREPVTETGDDQPPVLRTTGG